MEDKIFHIMPYVGLVEQNKAKLRELFDKFLEEPMLYGGNFMLYCSQGSNMYNALSSIETLDIAKEYILKQRRA